MTILLIAAVIGLLPAAIANGKGGNFVLWWIYGSLLFIIALPHALMMKTDTRAVEAQAVASTVFTTATRTATPLATATLPASATTPPSVTPLASFTAVPTVTRLPVTPAAAVATPFTPAVAPAAIQAPRTGDGGLR